MAEEVMDDSVRGLEYERFCTYPATQVLGAEVQEQYLYLVQPYKISVYEYYGQVKKPQLIEELIYNKLILNYSINKEYICIQTSSFIQIRDRHNWNKLIHTHPILNSQKSLTMMLSGHLLYISLQENSELQFEKIDILSKEATEIISLGQHHTDSSTPSFAKKPIFISKMGAINDFYIWGRDNKTVQLGMLYTQSGKLKKSFAISALQLKKHVIHRFFHHKINGNNTNLSSQYLILIAESEQTKELCLLIYEILPKCLSSKLDTQPANFQDKINQQFQHLGNLNKESKKISNLASLVLGEAFANYEENFNRLEVNLRKTVDFEDSFYNSQKIWIFTSSRICQIELLSQTHIEDMIKEGGQGLNQIIKSISYESKLKEKRGKGVYQDNILLCEVTTSFIIATSKEPSQSIAEQIIQDDLEEEENLPIANPTYQEMEELCKNIIETTLKEKEEENSQKHEEKPMTLLRNYSHKPFTSKAKDKNSLQSKVFSESHGNIESMTSEYAVQTDENTNKIDDLDEVQRLVAKYSSAFSVSCSKMKQNQHQKDKFEKEIKLIVESMAKTIIEPYLQQKFVTIVETKTKELSTSIKDVLYNQLQVLNQTMRKIQIKENNLKGKRVYQFSKQIQNIKTSISGVVDTIKERQVNKFACNQLIVEEAKAIKEKVTEIQKEIISLSTKNEDSEFEIHSQICEITELMTKLNTKSRSFEEQSEEEMDESDDESIQGKKEERRSGQESQDSSDSQDPRNQGKYSYHQSISRYPKNHQSAIYGKEFQQHSRHDSIRYPYPRYQPSQFLPPPPIPQPYPQYPYVPPAATMPFQPPYYHPPPMHQPMVLPRQGYDYIPEKGTKEKKQKAKKKK